jgi:integrase
MDGRNGMASGQLITRGEGKWLVRIYLGEIGGRRRYRGETVNGSRRDAQKVLTRLLRERDTGELTVKSKETLDEFLDRWLEGITASVKPRTHAEYSGQLKRYVRPYLGKARIGSIDALEVQKLYAQLHERGLSPRTIRMTHEVLRNALEAAVEMRLLARNPAATRLARKALPKKKRAERNVVGAEAVARFVEAALADDYAPYWLLLLFGGLRPEEALALRWADVAGDRVQVRRVLVDHQHVPHSFEEPKSETSRRSVTLPELVAATLREHRKKQAAARLAAGAEWQDGDLILCTATGEPLRQNALRRRFAKVREAAELPAMRVYDLRHSCATLLLSGGVPLKIVSERLGHAGIAITADTYSHVTEGMQQHAADTLAKLARG